MNSDTLAQAVYSAYLKSAVYAVLDSKWLTLDEAKELVQTTLVSDLPAADALTEIVTSHRNKETLLRMVSPETLTS